MRVLAFAISVPVVVALGRLTGLDWWPYLAWPALGVALVLALFSETPKGAGLGAAAIAFSVWMLLVWVYVVTGFNANIDGRENITSLGEAVWILLKAAAVIGVPLAIGTGVLAAIASWSGKRRSVTTA